MSKIDMLTDIFSTLRLRSDIYFHADLSGAFGVLVPQDRQHIRFHLVRQGTCCVSVFGHEETLRLVEGDLVIIPQGAAQILSDQPGRHSAPLADVLAKNPLDEGGVLRFGSGENRTRLLCGFCHFDEEVEHPVISNLPSAIILNAVELGREPWIGAALRLLSLEADLNEQGTLGVLSRLLEIVFLQTIRRSGFDDTASGYFAALKDPQLSKALVAIHERCDNAWTISELAKVAGMSRARFADKFTASVGMPPIAYLTNWRLMKSRRLLQESDLAIQEVAYRCGYASMPSFSRRFKVAYGVGPGLFRKEVWRR